MEEFDYRIRWRSAEVLPGAHRGLRDGPGSEFHGHVGLLGAPDPRRLDLRASLAMPGGGWLFRRTRQTSGIGVVLLADVSASMGAGAAGAVKGAAGGGHGISPDAGAGRMALLARLARLTGHSARHAGDSFGLVAADTAIRDDLWLAPSRAPGAIAEIADRLDGFVPTGHGHAGLIDAADTLAGRRRLVFVASDFCWPIDDVERLLTALAPHQVQPIVLGDAAAEAVPDWRGLVEIDDAEGGAARAAWLRPSQRARWQAALADWRVGLAASFAAHGLTPLHADASLAAEDITQWLAEGG
ncbi:hypothetical protein [Derxia gummosa]|uniref:DUF58 domain-containing protein n=1 Tax=Derxia gummosa DSM 723 TaxID=1121388 RepID=A0A8B6X8H0_9BURK|nr:hypothetical protein [Derxia gummosa]